MRIRIPMMSKKEDMEPLQSALSYAARASGRTEAELAKQMSWLLEGIADEVSRGKVVRIPGFGMFAPVPKKTTRDPHPRCRPVFVPNLAFLRQVLYGAPPNAAGRDAVRRHRKCHTYTDNPPKGRGSERVFTAMEKFRHDIDSQLAETS